jgi:hypothetical protein
VALVVKPAVERVVERWQPARGGLRLHLAVAGGVVADGVPRVRIHLPPAGSPLRTSLHARGPDPQALGSVDNDGGLCPKPAYLQAPWIIGKRACEIDYYASLPGTAILAFKARENLVNVG